VIPCKFNCEDNSCDGMLGIHHSTRLLSSLFLYPTRKHRGGDHTYVVSRPLLYDLLLRQIPPHKIHMGKRVLSILQNEHGVMIRCSDNQTHHGDILVGADGAYSGVRQSLYKQLKTEKKLPKRDDGVLPFTCSCLVGQTDPLDPEEFPEIEEEHCRFSSIMGGKYPYSVRVVLASR
jgi:2-polyprenyl-6-methoxyphenol hydroxylase-like FAD-dependent oxidoreductase